MSRANEHLTYDQHQEVESHVATYLKVWVALLIFTVMEYIYAMMFQAHFGFLVLGLMTMAMTKAVLVALYFMHLKFEGRWVYFMIVPACILAMILVVALYPDIGAPKSPLPRGLDEDIAAISAPFDSAAAVHVI